jgi:hypothetical protein
MGGEEDLEEELEDTRDEIKGVIEAMEASTKKEASGEKETSSGKKEKKDTEEEPERKFPDGEPNTEESFKKEKNEEPPHGNGNGKFVDPETGEEFDTASGLKLYQEYVKE